MGKHLHLIALDFLPEYSRLCPVDWQEVSRLLRGKHDFTEQDFDYYITASSLFSSKIEGNTLDFNSFYRNREKKTSVKKKEIAEVEALVAAYRFAAENQLNRANFLKADAILSKTLLPAGERGKVRKCQMEVIDSATGLTTYIAVESEFVSEYIALFFEDIAMLLDRDLSYKETFYYASMVHLWLVLIHPFGDGNGRAARLLEKWFIVTKIGVAAWSITSEKYYWDHLSDYYQNIALGFNLYALKWERCIPFLLMLPASLAETK